MSFSDDLGNEEILTSATTATVAWSSTCKDNAHKIGGLSADAVSQDGFAISWTALGCPGDYLVRHWQTDDKDNTFTAVTVSHSETSYTASGLTAETSYTIRVLYQDPDGGRPWKAPPSLEVTTLAAAVQPVIANSPATGAPTISGAAQVGETLTAGTVAIADADGLTNAAYAYQWLADGSAISGATAST